MLSFIITVVVLTGVMGFTTPGLLDKVRLGLDLKGGFEILYHAEPMDTGGTLTRASLQKQRRAWRNGRMHSEQASLRLQPKVRTASV